jgi:hypothetical protein
LALLFVAGSVDAGSYSFATASAKQQSLNLNIQEGGIANAGPQIWNMSGGNLEIASDTATSVLSRATWSTVNFALGATINGLSAGGTFRLHLKGTTKSGETIQVRVHTNITGAIPAVCFPSYSVTGTCLQNDTSEIPAYFIATGFVRIVTGGNFSPEYNVTLIIEDAALNPYGGPIVITSADGLLLIVATYRHARTMWEGVQTGGSITGTLGSTAVSGSFVQYIQTNENYVNGTAHDSGQIALVGMTPSKLDSVGTFHGTSTIPTNGTVDCSPPGLPGTCTETAYYSSGKFSTDPIGLQIAGNYSVYWPAPSIIFGGNITAQVTQKSTSS